MEQKLGASLGVAPPVTGVAGMFRHIGHNHKSSLLSPFFFMDLMMT
jgi:hypothetical protein